MCSGSCLKEENSPAKQSLAHACDLTSESECQMFVLCHLYSSCSSAKWILLLSSSLAASVAYTLGRTSLPADAHAINEALLMR